MMPFAARVASIGLFGVCAVVAGCAPTSRWAVMRTITAQFAGDPHQCVPLGWAPLPAFGNGYVIGTSIQLQQSGWWLPAIWVGFVKKTDANRPQIRSILLVLDHLQREGLVHRRAIIQRPDSTVNSGRTVAFEYNLTLRGMHYYYDENDSAGNPLHLPYLCYSTIVPDNVVWTQPVHLERDAGAGNVEVFRTSFTWHASENASWAADPVILSHSVVLPPDKSPVLAKFIKPDHDWLIGNTFAAASAYPQLLDRWVWPQFNDGYN